MKTRTVLWSSVIIVACSTGLLKAQAPVGTAFTYQGQLKQGGLPVTNTADFQFKLWDALAGGNQIGAMIPVNGKSVVNGLFTVTLDFGAGAFAGDARWLEIAVRSPAGSGGYTTLTPRQELTPASYSLYANSAGSVTGGITGSGTANYIPKFTGTATLGNSALYQGQIGSYAGMGINTTAVSADLCLYGSVGSLKLFNPATGTGYNGLQLSFITDNSVDAVLLNREYGSLKFGTNDTERVMITRDGNVGIGISSPTQKLHLNGHLKINGWILSDGNQALEFYVNDARALRLEPHFSPNVIGGYYGNYVTAGVYGATIAGGGYSGPNISRVTDLWGTIGGGLQNQAGDNAGSVDDHQCATVSGGFNNVASGESTTIGGGSSNVASMSYGAIGGGQFNVASGWAATVAGGYMNTASAFGAMVPGGEGNVAQGDHSFAAGWRAKANANGCFVWGDDNNADVACAVSNRWVARASGGVYFYTNAALNSGVYVAAGGNAWNAISDRATKENFAHVDTRGILERVAGLPVQTYNLKSQDPAIRHLGPVAQDFSAAFGFGESNTAINMEDADGVALAAIQGLYEIVCEKDAEIETLRKQNGQLEARLAAVERSLAQMHQPKQGVQP
jgi:hypothetical protein